MGTNATPYPRADQHTIVDALRLSLCPAHRTAVLGADPIPDHGTHVDAQLSTHRSAHVTTHVAHVPAFGTAFYLSVWGAQHAAHWATHWSA